MTSKIVKEFLKNHPRVFVKHHWRMNELGAAQRESFLAPRTAYIRPKEIRFETMLGSSHLALGEHVTGEIDGDLLHITFAGNTSPAPHVTYQAIPD